jgi:GST-like protein
MMIDVHYWPTPNGWKVTIMLEECGLPYRVAPVNILEGEQFEPDFRKIAPNNRIPAIIDHAPAGGGGPVSIFESGAILIYLAEKTGKFLPKDGPARYDVLQWLMWQMGGVGPMSGQAAYFRNYTKDKIEHAINRYTNEVNRLYGVLDTRLKDSEFMAGAYSIADMATYPWVILHANLGQTLDDFPHMKRWFDTIRARPAVERGYAVMEETRKNRKRIDDKTR